MFVKSKNNSITGFLFLFIYFFCLSYIKILIKNNIINIHKQIDQDYYLYCLQTVCRTTYVQVVHISELVPERLLTSLL
jgi:hypothetical protein